MQALFYRQLRTPLPHGVEEMCFSWAADFEKEKHFIVAHYEEIKAMILLEINTCDLLPDQIFRKMQIFSKCLDYLDSVIKPLLDNFQGAIVSQKRAAHQSVLDKWALNKAMVANGTTCSGPGITDMRIFEE